jgi:hypothetical protein
MNFIAKFRRLGESVWEVDQKFKRLKGKLKYILLIHNIGFFLLIIFFHT